MKRRRIKEALSRAMRGAFYIARLCFEAAVKYGVFTFLER
jgi:hypothetical protein